MSDKVTTMNITIDSFKKFLSYIKELSLIDPTIVLSISDDDMMIYSFVGKNLNDIHAFKTVITPTSEIFNKKKTIDNRIKFIIKDGRKFVKNIQTFVEFNDDVKFKISYDTIDYNGNYLHISNSKLKLKEISGDPILMSKEITKEDIEMLTDKSTSLFNFSIMSDDFKKIKRLSTIENTNDILQITIRDNELFIGENKWELKICDIDKPDLSVSFPKKYFNKLTLDDNSLLYMFENYILISDSNSELMIVLEMSI